MAMVAPPQDVLRTSLQSSFYLGCKSSQRARGVPYSSSTAIPRHGLHGHLVLHRRMTTQRLFCSDGSTLHYAFRITQFGKYTCPLIDANKTNVPRPREWRSIHTMTQASASTAALIRSVLIVDSCEGEPVSAVGVGIECEGDAADPRVEDGRGARQGRTFSSRSVRKQPHSPTSCITR